MRLLIRLSGGTGTALDLRLELAEDVTVGELADHLADLTGEVPGRTLVTAEPGDTARTARRLQRDDEVRAAGPRSGTTVHLAAADATTPTAAVASPVSLVPPASAPIRLPYGRTIIDGAVIEVGERVDLAATAGVTPTLNGQRLLGSSRLGPGDLIWTGEQTVEVRFDGPLRPPAPLGPGEPLRRTAALREARDPVTVDLPVPPTTMRLPGFPVLSAVVPLLMGAGLWVATRSVASVVFVLFSFVFIVASGIEARREARAEQRFREEEFRRSFDDRRAEVDRLRTTEHSLREHASPPVADLLRLVLHRDARVWERTIPSAADGGSLVVRIGTALQVASDRVAVPATGRRDLLAELRDYAAEVERTELPVIVDLDRTNGLALVGAGERPTAVARSAVLQLATLLGPDDLEVCVLAAPDRADAWRWCDWLPHTSPGDRASRTLLVVDGADPNAVAARLHRANNRAVRVLWLSPSNAGLPQGIRAVASFEDGHRARLSLLREDGTIEERVEDIAAEDLTPDEVAPVARSLAPLTPVTALSVDAATEADRVGPPLPASVALEEVVASAPAGVPPGDGTASFAVGDVAGIVDRWQQARAAATLGAPIGRADRGSFNVDLRADGPHALVAGTTGSGKSELLRTLVASLALHHSPDRLTFLLVDYKGGAAFGALTALPHTVGVITDLDGDLAARALRSLRAEVRRREEVLAAHGVSDLAELDADDTAGRPPALAVVVDEFATLARELPDFVDGLVDVAQRGRSLGVHLVLATQRPAGVVTDAIRANTTLRLALRVTDEDDSRDVVDSPVAAHLPREVPGRAVVRVGPSRTAHVQIAWSGGTLRPGRRIVSCELGRPLAEPAPAPEDPGNGQLATAVTALARAAVAAGVPAPRRPWVDPLPDRLTLAEVPPSPAADRLHLGLIDRPDLQRRDPLAIDLTRDGGVLVLGASRSGRSTTLCTIAAALTGDHAPPAHIHAIDGGRGLAGLRGRRGVGDIVPAEDTERVLRLLRATDAELARRSAEPSRRVPRRVILVDGFAAFEELHERVNRGEGADLLVRLARDGRSVGMHLVVAANRRAELPPALASALGGRLFLRSATEDDALLAGLPAASADPATPPGRGHLDGDVVQVAVDLPAPAVPSPGAGGPEPVPLLPRSVALAGLVPHDEPVGEADEWSLPLGLDADRLGMAHLDLRHHHALVAGPPRSGVSTTLDTIAAGAEAAFLIGARPPVDQTRWTGSGTWRRDEDGWIEVLDAAADAARSARTTVLAIDHLPELLDRAEGHRLEQRLLQLLDPDEAPGLRIVLGGEIDAMTRCYSEVVTRLRSGRTGVLLQPDTDLHGALLHSALGRRDELPSCPGRGWLVGPGTAIPVQVATP